jgi:glycosyltransferase involved in cell wall biosynthesis
MGTPRVVQVDCHIDPQRRAPEALLAAWWTQPAFAQAASRAGVDVTVVQAASRDAVIERDGVAFHFVRERPGTRWRRRLGLWATPLPWNLARRVAELRPHLIHLHSLSFPLHARFLGGRVPGAPVLVQDHKDGLPPRWRRSVDRFGLARIAGTAFTVRAQAKPFIDAGVLRADLPVFELLENSSRFSPGTQVEARARTGLRGDPCLLWLGHLNANKDPLMVLDALGRAAADLKDPHLWCCYLTAPLLDQVVARIATDPRLAGRVHLLGPRPRGEVEHLLRAADFLVQGSHVEGSGFAVIEALACGTTPLVTDVPSFRRITGDGVFGGLCPPGDSGMMARVLVQWSARDRAALRTAARAHFERALSFETIGAELRTAYAALLGGA